MNTRQCKKFDEEFCTRAGITLLLLFINILSFMWGFYTYIPETNHVRRGYTVAANLSMLSLIIIIIIIIIIGCFLNKEMS